METLEQYNNRQTRIDASGYIPTINDLIREQIQQARIARNDDWSKTLNSFIREHNYIAADKFWKTEPSFESDGYNTITELQKLVGLWRLRKTLRSLTRNSDNKISSLVQCEQVTQLSKFLTAFLYPVSEFRNEEISSEIDNSQLNEIGQNPQSVSYSQMHVYSVQKENPSESEMSATIHQEATHYEIQEHEVSPTANSNLQARLAKLHDKQGTN